MCARVYAKLMYIDILSDIFSLHSNDKVKYKNILWFKWENYEGIAEQMGKNGKLTLWLVNFKLN